jgi:hypothetical protein
METAAQLETVENELHVFHRSHRAWKTRQTAPSFPQFPQPLLLDIVYEEKRKTIAERFNQNRVDKTPVKA